VAVHALIWIVLQVAVAMNRIEKAIITFYKDENEN
jgi:hypothetical protein